MRCRNDLNESTSSLSGKDNTDRAGCIFEEVAVTPLWQIRGERLPIRYVREPTERTKEPVARLLRESQTCVRHFGTAVKKQKQKGGTAAHCVVLRVHARVQYEYVYGA